MRTGYNAASGELPREWFAVVCDTKDEASFAYDRHVASVAARESIE